MQPLADLIAEELARVLEKLDQLLGRLIAATDPGAYSPLRLDGQR